MLGLHRPTSETFKWRFGGGSDDGPVIVLIGIGEHYFWCNSKIYVIRIGPPLAKLSGSAHDNEYIIFVKGVLMSMVGSCGEYELLIVLFYSCCLYFCFSRSFSYSVQQYTC